MFENLNKNGKATIKEGVELEKMEFVKLSQFVGREIPVEGFFISKGKFGEQVSVIGCGYKINMPKRAVAQFEEIRDNEEMLKAVLDGHLKITDIKPITTKGGLTVAYTLTDC